VRAVILRAERLLLVNAWPGAESDLWCAPGGGVEAGAALPDNLAREVAEETGIDIVVGHPCLINEFHEPESGFHQVELFFRCTVAGAAEPSGEWRDPEGVVNRRRWVGAGEIGGLRVKPDSLARVAWSDAFAYDPLERLVR